MIAGDCQSRRRWGRCHVVWYMPGTWSYAGRQLRGPGLYQTANDPLRQRDVAHCLVHPRGVCAGKGKELLRLSAAAQAKGAFSGWYSGGGCTTRVAGEGSQVRGAAPSTVIGGHVGRYLPDLPAVGEGQLAGRPSPAARRGEARAEGALKVPVDRRFALVTAAGSGPRQSARGGARPSTPGEVSTAGHHTTDTSRRRCASRPSVSSVCGADLRVYHVNSGLAPRLPGGPCRPAAEMGLSAQCFGTNARTLAERFTEGGGMQSDERQQLAASPAAPAGSIDQFPASASP